MKTEVSISERLKDLRVEKKLNLEELAELTGISKSALGSYELDTPREMNHKNLIALADFYKVSVDYLLGRTENKNLPNAPLSELRLSDATVELLKSGSINNRLLCELVTHEKFAELLTDDEEAELQSRINELVAKDGQDIGIVTVEDESVMSTQEFADEFYENSGMGIGENRTGVLFCIDMYNRETYLTTTGDMIDIIDDQRREEIFDAQMEYLANGDYMGAFSEALDYTDKFIEMGVADDHTGINAATGEVMDPSEYGSPYTPERQKTPAERTASAAMLGGIGGLIGLLAGLIAKSSIQKSYARKYVPSEYNWRAKSKLNLRVNDSKLVNKFVTTRVIPRNNDSGPRSGGGGHSTSTVHMSSGGMYHGGGGRKF